MTVRAGLEKFIKGETTGPFWVRFLDKDGKIVGEQTDLESVYHNGVIEWPYKVTVSARPSELQFGRGENVLISERIRAYIDKGDTVHSQVRMS